ncbi:VOC family protein [Paenibacillus flagellatus]|uniref:VOC family protein n=1 Tax=Paenibacillus flagellatus TaxID=2211139 RepID=A0A2V5KGM4_9BACL|nr:VOC family protein [Paenibacillus flagellatus]PYI57543.1 VOC family protein [Paenibacillus flagellatus]
MTNPLLNRVDTIFVHVTDLERSIRWYSELLGLDVREGPHAGPIYTLDMGPGRPGLTLDNHGLDDDYQFVPSNQPLFNLTATDIEAAYERVKSHGAEIVSGIVRFPDLSEFTFKDLDGNIIMVCQMHGA